VVQTQIAAYRGDATSIDGIVKESMVDLASTDIDIGRFALCLAVERSNAHTAQSLLKAGVTVDALDVVGQTSLFRATRRGDESMIKLLLAAGAGIEVRDNQDKTALAVNAHLRNEKALRVLLRASADVNTRTADGSSICMLLHLMVVRTSPDSY
jgi:ankyrin repeat protein